MDKRQEISAEPREECGKIAARRLRQSGKIPAVLYGRGREPINVAIEKTQLIPVMAHGAYLTHVFDFNIAGDASSQALPVMVKEVQRNPLGGEVLNIDFHVISLTEKVTAHVPIVLTGEPIGQKKGGIIERLHQEVEVSCLPTNIPEQLEIDISAMDIGDTLHAENLTIPEGVELVTANEEVLVVLAPPAKPIEEEVAPTEEEEEGEPEVLAQKSEQEAASEEGEEKK